MDYNSSLFYVLYSSKGFIQPVVESNIISEYSFV